MELKFSLDDLRLLESHFKLNSDFETKNSEPVEISSDIGISYKRDNKIVKVIVSVNSHGEKQPFVFDTKIGGTFVFSKLPNKEQLDKIVHINCAAIIFPYVREAIADLTRRAGLPPFHLGPLNFVALYDKNRESLAQKKEDQVRKNTPKEGRKRSE
jgi:preprotein translocase subunit SecB